MNFAWRHVIGAFQLTIPVDRKDLLLPRLWQQLSVLRWIGGAIPQESRWYPVWSRYIEQMEARVTAFGG